MSTWDRISNFVTAHRAAVLLGSAAVIGSTAGVYYYYNVSNPSSTRVKKSKKKSSSDKKKSSKKSDDSSKKEIAGFPLTQNDDGYEYPEVPDNFNFKNLSESDRKIVATEFKSVGNKYFAQKKFDNALDFYQRALDVYKDPVFYSNRAACYSSLEEYDKVVQETTKALGLRPDYVKCIVRRAVAYDKLGELENSVVDYTCALILSDFTDTSLNHAVDRVLRELSEKEAKLIIDGRVKKSFPSPSFCASYYKTVTRLAVLPDFLEEAEPNSSDYDMKLAVEALRKESTESYEQALELFNSAITKDGPHTYFALANRAVLKYLMADLPGAQKDATDSIALEGNVLSYLVRSSIALEESDLTTINAELAQAEAVDSKSPYVFFHKAQLQFMMGQLKQAKEGFDKAFELDPGFVLARVQSAVSLYRLGKISESHEIFEELKKEFPKSIDPRNYLGELYLDQRKLTEASEEFDKAIELSKGNSEAISALPLVNKALACFQKGQLNEAIDLCRKAITLDPKSDIAYTALAQIYLQNQESEEAYKILMKCVNITRSQQEIVQQLTLAYAAKTQVRLMKERPFVREKLEKVQADARARALAEQLASGTF